ncbi:MAG: 16S rRNA (cytosine(1402)-N(4))-methyltransferase RsmH [bacterium]|nr:16S rRNA (cytosine(1402)-N(4))-methyltransferase RsmH [bacterium]
MVQHVPVLLKQITDILAVKGGEIFLDCTLGGGGHSASICQATHGEARIIGLDIDEDAEKRVENTLKKEGCRFQFFNQNFKDLDNALAKAGVSHVHAILYDLGWSSFQTEISGRGFSFKKDEPLLMTFSKNPKADDLTAQKILNSWEEENIELILKVYGEERFARRIARRITERRQTKEILTTFELVEIVKSAIPASAKRKGGIHPATKTFQALRIAVNDEMSALKKGLQNGFEALNSEGKMAVISFHSLEDRIVKRTFSQWAKEEKGKIITKKPLTADEAETENNPRSRSAKLRVFQKY